MLQKFNQILITYLGNYYNDVIHSFVSLCILFSIYLFLSFLIKKKIENISQKRNYLINLRNIFIVLVILVEIFLWSGEIKTFFISATAIFAAFMVSFKELIMSFVGSLFITSNKLFSLGDIIQINEIQGKVIDKNLFFTKLSISDGLGKKELFIPNKFFIDTNFMNLSNSNGFRTLKLELVVNKISDIKRISDELHKKIIIISKKQEEKYKEFVKDDIFLEKVKKFHEIKYDFNFENSKIIISLFIYDKEKDEVEKELVNLYLEEINKWKEYMWKIIKF